MEMYNNPIISFIVPVFNVKNYLHQCLDSIIKVNIKKEILLIDDGSTDGSRDILKQYQQQYPFITLICQSNKGVSTARNKGILLAKGKYLQFVDPDDFLLTEDYQKLVQLADNANADMLRGQYLWILPDEQRFTVHQSTLSRLFDIPKNSQSAAINGKIFLQGYLKQHFPVIWLGFFRTETLRENRILFEEGISSAEDSIFMLDIFAVKDLNVVEVFEPIYGYRFNVNGLSKKRGNTQRIENTFKAIEKLRTRYEYYFSLNNSEICNAIDTIITDCSEYAYKDYENLSLDNRMKVKDFFSKDIIDRAERALGRKVEF